ncbi:MAG: GNAT family N-acetyltransferase [Acidimicrobiaceae bacterium]|nr:GNAT family N-acetyltransferase [Acidimicrobiaceae bacterium]MYD07711.1 GNAT family N-acetyltransferase [Acidimicrobiaceae bacterium]MYI59798.1 GNAT family N-acetyltransferase [Acidimicrobiaceae bacterium]
MAVRALLRDEVSEYKAIRLRALSIDPEAFCSTHERESGFDETTWKGRLTSFDGRPGTVFVEENDGELLAMLGVGCTPIHGQATIWGMWVDPVARRRGSARRLLDAAFDWCSRQGLTSLTLEVLPQSSAAIALYRSVGFTESRSTDGDADGIPMSAPVIRGAENHHT